MERLAIERGFQPIPNISKIGSLDLLISIAIGQVPFVTRLFRLKIKQCILVIIGCNELSNDAIFLDFVLWNTRSAIAPLAIIGLDRVDDRFKDNRLYLLNVELVWKFGYWWNFHDFSLF